MVWVVGMRVADMVTEGIFQECRMTQVLVPDREPQAVRRMGYQG